MYLLKFCSHINRIVRFIIWKAKVKMAVAYMFKENAIEAVYSFILLQYRRPRTVMQLSNYFVSQNRFDQHSKEAFFKEVYKVTKFWHTISIIPPGLLAFLFLSGTGHFIKDGETFWAIAAIGGTIFSLTILLSSFFDYKTKKKEMRKEIEMYTKQ